MQLISRTCSSFPKANCYIRGMWGSYDAREGRIVGDYRRRATRERRGEERRGSFIKPLGRYDSQEQAGGFLLMLRNLRARGGLYSHDAPITAKDQLSLARGTSPPSTTATTSLDCLLTLTRRMTSCCIEPCVCRCRGIWPDSEEGFPHTTRRFRSVAVWRIGGP